MSFGGGGYFSCFVIPKRLFFDQEDHMPGIGVISNANARLNKMSPLLKDSLNFIVGRRGEVISTYTLEDVGQAVRDFKRYDVDMIAISGGDGTIHKTIEGLLREYGADPLPPLLLLPSGTQNMIPRSFGIRNNSIATMLLALTRYKHNIPMRIVRRNLLEVNGHHCFLFGIGTPTRYLRAHYARGTSHWHAASLLGIYIWDGLKNGIKAHRLLEPMRMRASLDDGPEFEMAPNSVFCSFTEEIALHFRMFPRAGWQKDHFEILITSSSITATIAALPLLWWGTRTQPPQMERRMARSMRMILETPEPFTLDGDLYNPVTEFNLGVGPELSFVVPGVTRLDPAVEARAGRIGPWGSNFIV